MNGRIAAGGLVAVTLLFGAGLWYSLEYAYYRRVSLGPGLAMTLVPVSGGPPVEIAATDFEGINATSSPIRFRACFKVATPLSEIAAHYAPYSGAMPLVGPHWFSCFDAGKITRALGKGEAKAFLSVKAAAPEVDRVIAIFPDGRAFAWQQLDPAVPADNSPGE